MIVELHFQDGFEGETIEVSVNHALRARITPKTRYQINLAHMETVEVEEGDMLKLHAPESKISAEIRVERNHKYYMISRRADKLLVKPTGELPKYL